MKQSLTAPKHMPLPVQRSTFQLPTRHFHHTVYKQAGTPFRTRARRMLASKARLKQAGKASCPLMEYAPDFLYGLITTFMTLMHKTIFRALWENFAPAPQQTSTPVVGTPKEIRIIRSYFIHTIIISTLHIYSFQLHTNGTYNSWNKFINTLNRISWTKQMQTNRKWYTKVILTDDSSHEITLALLWRRSSCIPITSDISSIFRPLVGNTITQANKLYMSTNGEIL